MHVYISLLRGVNVGGQGLIKMKELRTALLGLKFEQVQTSIQSGNILFVTKKSDQDALSLKIDKIVTSQFGFNPQSITLTLNQLQAIFDHNPYLNETSGDKKLSQQSQIDLKTLYVTFLKSTPEVMNLEALKNIKSGNDTLVLSKQCLYLHCPGGYGKTKLNNQTMERLLKTPATTRNWNTLTRLTQLGVQIQPTSG